MSATNAGGWGMWGIPVITLPTTTSKKKSTSFSTFVMPHGNSILDLCPQIMARTGWAPPAPPLPLARLHFHRQTPYTEGTWRHLQILLFDCIAWVFWEKATCLQVANKPHCPPFLIMQHILLWWWWWLCSVVLQDPSCSELNRNLS